MGERHDTVLGDGFGPRCRVNITTPRVFDLDVDKVAAKSVPDGIRTLSSAKIRQGVCGLDNKYCHGPWVSFKLLHRTETYTT